MIRTSSLSFSLSLSLTHALIYIPLRYKTPEGEIKMLNPLRIFQKSTNIYTWVGIRSVTDFWHCEMLWEAGVSKAQTYEERRELNNS
jgi:hypothetical protein